MAYDLLIKNGRIIDGSGMPAFVGDVAVRHGKIIALGKLSGFFDSRWWVRSAIFPSMAARSPGWSCISTSATIHANGWSALRR